MARDDPHFRLRLPETLRDRIATSARDANRSINAEIVARLQSSFDLETAATEQLAGMEARFKALVAADNERQASLVKKMEFLSEQLEQLVEASGIRTRDP